MVTEIQPEDWVWWRNRLGPLYEPAGFCRIEWIEAWAQAFLPYEDWSAPMVGHAIVDGSRTLGILPLATQRVGPLRVRSLAGPYAPYRTIPVSGDPDDMRRFAQAIADGFQRRPPSAVLRFGPVLASDRGVRTLVDALLTSGWSGMVCLCGPVLTLTIPAATDEFLRSVSPSLLKNVKYIRRRLAKDVGQLSIERHVLGMSCIDILTTVAAIESGSWVARETGDTKFLDKKYLDFWSRLGQQPAAGPEVVLWILRAGGQAVSFSAHVETSHSIHVIANGYDERWKIYSPGSVLSHDILLDACARGGRLLDWGQGDSGYKQRWGARDTDRLIDLLLFRPGLVGAGLARLANLKLKNWQRLDTTADGVWGMI